MVHQLHAIVYVVSCSFHSETLRLVLGERSTLWDVISWILPDLTATVWLTIQFEYRYFYEVRLKHHYQFGFPVVEDTSNWPRSCVLHQTLDPVSRLLLRIACQLQTVRLYYDLSKFTWLPNVGQMWHIQPMFLHPAVLTTHFSPSSPVVNPSILL